MYTGTATPNIPTSFYLQTRVLHTSVAFLFNENLYNLIASEEGESFSCINESVAINWREYRKRLAKLKLYFCKLAAVDFH